MARILSKSTWPAENPELEAALGRFIIAWGVLEQQMDFAINLMSGLDHDLASAVTANLGTKAKIDMFQAMAACMQGVIGEEVLAEANTVAGVTSNASGQLRNFIVHGQPFQLKLEDGNREIWAKFAARKGGVKGSAVRLSAEYVEIQTKEVRALVERWTILREKAFKALSLYDLMPADLKGDSGD